MKHKASIPSIKPTTASAGATPSVLHSLLNVSTTPLKKPKTFKLNSDGDCKLPRTSSLQTELVEPHSKLCFCTVLSRVASFLPQLKCANDKLEIQRAQGEILDIEHIEEGAQDQQHIEMDLGLGVFDYAPEDIGKIAKPEIMVKLPHGESSESDEDEDIKLATSKQDEEEESNANAVQDLMRAVVEQQGASKKKSRKKKRPLIQVIS
ncbi:hypothetical protein HDU81_010012 [Chytriomyces hyalinus]|nr:hypothetical protein HDU81_010012 [Chytriomyces hyalinus]